MPTSTTEKINIVVKLPIGRCGYPKLNPTNPPLQGLPPNERKRWSLSLYLSKADAQRLQKDIDAAVASFEEKYDYEPARAPKLKQVKEWANKEKTRRSHPQLLGMDSLELGANAENPDGGLFPPPQYIDADREPIPHTDIYPGCYVRAVAQLTEYAAKGKDGKLVSHGLAFRLKIVQFIKDGDRLGGDTTDYLKYLDDDTDDAYEV